MLTWILPNSATKVRKRPVPSLKMSGAIYLLPLHALMTLPNTLPLTSVQTFLAQGASRNTGKTSVTVVQF
jgi:hypothetical protein